MVYEELLRRFVTISCDVFKGRLTGVYLHGSAVMDCFNPKKSDLDLLVVTEGSPSDEEKKAFLEQVVPLNREGPAKGIEWSVVKRECCSLFVYPTSFELHFSPAHLARYEADPNGYIAGMKGTDRDLAAHFNVILHRGTALCGEPVSSVFAPVPREAYLDSLWYDIEAAEEEIADQPVYLTLNLCRVLAFLKEERILSKKEGGEWGRKHLPDRFACLAEAALVSYAGDSEMSFDPDLACAFAAWALKEIKSMR